MGKDKEKALQGGLSVVELHQSRKWTLMHPPVRIKGVSEGRDLRPGVLPWGSSLHVETWRVWSKCSHLTNISGKTHRKLGRVDH